MARTIGALALRPMGNAQGGYCLLSLNTGIIITERSYTPLTIPAEVVKRVNAMPRKTRSKNKLTFQYKDLSEAQDNLSNNLVTIGI